MQEKITILRAHMKGVGAVPFGAALALLLAPIFGLFYGAAVATAILFGGAAMLLWGKNALSPDKLDSRLLLAVGVGTLLAPWVIGFGYMTSASFAIHTLAGLAIIGAVGYEFLKAKQASDKIDTGTDGAATT